MTNISIINLKNRMMKNFKKFIENKRKIQLLKKIKKASQKDFIGDGTIGDGI